MRGEFGFAVLDNFSCGISVILILNCSIAVFSEPQDAVMQSFSILDSIKNYPQSPPIFSKPFPGSMPMNVTCFVFLSKLQTA